MLRPDYVQTRKRDKFHPKRNIKLKLILTLSKNCADNRYEIKHYLGWLRINTQNTRAVLACIQWILIS